MSAAKIYLYIFIAEVKDPTFYTIFPHMKKLILILSILAINAFAIDCRGYMNYFVNHASIYDFSEYRIDSAYIANESIDLIYYSPLKYHYTENNLDSLVRCVGEKCWTFEMNISKEKTDSSTKVSISFEKDQISNDIILFNGKDSAVSYNYSDDKEKPGVIVSIGTLFLHNDSLYESWEDPDDISDKRSTITTPDPNDENVCLVTKIVSPAFESPKTETYQETIINTENGFVLSASNTEEKKFFVFTNESTTSLNRKILPAMDHKNAPHFDLLGRSIKNKSKIGHTMQVTK